MKWKVEWKRNETWNDFPVLHAAQTSNPQSKASDELEIKEKKKNPADDFVDASINIHFLTILLLLFLSYLFDFF
jgi:hypothetical protein